MSTPPPLASIDQLAHRLGVETADLDGPRAGADLDDASALVRDEAGQSYLTTEGALDSASIPAIVVAITLASARRAYENPSNVTQKSAQDVSMSYAARGDSAVYLTADECTRLRRAGGRMSIGTIQTTRGGRYSETGYVPTGTEDVWFPWYSEDLWS